MILTHKICGGVAVIVCVVILKYSVTDTDSTVTVNNDGWLIIVETVEAVARADRYVLKSDLINDKEFGNVCTVKLTRGTKVIKYTFGNREYCLILNINTVLIQGTYKVKINVFVSLFFIHISTVIQNICNLAHQIIISLVAVLRDTDSQSKRADAELRDTVRYNRHSLVLIRFLHELSDNSALTDRSEHIV